MPPRRAGCLGASLSSELLELYRRTRYEAETPLGRVCIRIDQRAAALDELLDRHGTGSWCFITAWNPGSARQPPALNLARNRELRAALAALQVLACFDGHGIADGDDWSEESFLALGVDRSSALALGRRFGQHAVVWGQARAAAQLLLCAAR